MKKRILITSILLSLTTVVLIGYFVVGCSSLEDIVSRRNAPQEVAWAKENETDAETGVQPVAVAEPERLKDGAESRDKVVAQDVADKEDNTPADGVAVKTDSSRIAYGDEVTYPENWREVVARPGEKPAPPARIRTPQQSVEGRSREPQSGRRVGIMRGDDRKTRALDEYKDIDGDVKKYNFRRPVRPDSSADGRSVNGGGMIGGGYGGGMRPGSSAYSQGGYGGMGGMMGGGRRFGTQPTGPQAQGPIPGLSNLQTISPRQLWREEGSVSVRSIPVELLNVSADELWIIAKAEVQVVPVPPDDDGPGTGAMLAKLPKKDKKIPLPLKHTDVKGQISGYIATVNVTQQFHNPYDEKIEAVYVFPLPQNAAINEFIMTVGERRIRGIIRERKQAERIYQQARAQGHVASLLTQERPNIFTQKVANIEPSKKIDVNIKYFNTLAYVDGWYEFVFPMVVGP
ncbi:MAG: VIT domain-containing protein [Planctomycetota bacterium]